MITTAILNAVLALGVILMVITPLVWAILTQHRDHAGPAAIDATTEHVPQSHDLRRAPRPQYKPLTGRA